MSVKVGSAAIELAGRCPTDEAERLLELLLAHPDLPIDWRACEHAHTAVVQVLLAAGRPVLGPPLDGFLAQWVEPVLPRR